jgi:predicted transcriptional regulator
MANTVRLDTPIDPETDRELTANARAQGRAKADVVAEALQRYLDHERWFRARVEEGLRADADGDVLDHAAAMAELASRRPNSPTSAI